MMEFDNLIKLINTVSGSGLTGFRYEADGVKLRMTKGDGQRVETSVKGVSVTTDETAADTVTAVPASLPETYRSSETDGYIVKSPLVGTFYSAPSEDAESFVAVGDIVKKGQTLAIIEAMKLMNEIESEYDGTVAEILAENGQPVEYGQPLFRITGGLL